MRKSVVAAVIAASATLSACGRAHEEDSGPTVSRTYQVGNFQEIEVAGPYDVDIRTGGNPGVSAQGSQKLLERTLVEVKGDKLIIHPERQKGWFHIGWSNRGKASFTVTVPQLGGATTAGSGDIKVDHVRGESFEGTVAGSGGITIGTADVQTLKLAIAGSGDAKAGAGTAKSVEYEIAGTGGIDASQVKAERAKVSIVGSGDIKAQATGVADVDIMGSGDVEVTGGAKCQVNKAGSGDVRCL